MYSSPRPVSELYQPEAPHQLVNAEVTNTNRIYGYTIAYEVDEHGNDVPYWSNTAVFRIAPRGMTEPVLVTNPKHTARFSVETLRGQGAVILALASGGADAVDLRKGDGVEIRPGQAYSYVNFSKRNSLLLKDVATPAFEQEDEAKLAMSSDLSLRMAGGNNGRPRKGALDIYAEAARGIQPGYRPLPARFFELLGEAIAGRL